MPTTHPITIIAGLHAGEHLRRRARASMPDANAGYLIVHRVLTTHFQTDGRTSAAGLDAALDRAPSDHALTP